MRICFTPQSDPAGNVGQSPVLDFACLVDSVKSGFAVFWNHVASCVCGRFGVCHACIEHALQDPLGLLLTNDSITSLQLQVSLTLVLNLSE